MSLMSLCRRYAGCTTEIVPARKHWSIHGFRLPSALDNRPMRFEEFEKMINQAIFVSATPGNYELEQTKGEIIEQIIRPTGLLDPVVTVRPTQGQIDDLVDESVLALKRMSVR